MVSLIREDWGKEPQSEICISILDYLSSRLANPPRHITNALLQQIAGSRYSSAEILIAVQYVCGDRVHLLEPRFELIEDDQAYDIAKSELRLAHKTGQLVHPETGELIDNFEDKVFIYFEPSFSMMCTVG